MPRPTSPYRVAVFYGASDDVATEVAPDNAARILNMYRDRGTLIGRKGSAPHTDREIPGASDTIDGLFWCRIEEGSHLFLASDGDLYDVFPPVPPILLNNGSDRLTPETTTSFAWIDQKVYAGDGILPNVRIDATSVAQVHLDPPPAGMVATVTAGGTLGTGVTYSYRVTFLNADGIESGQSAVVTANTATSAGFQEITLSSIPVAASSTNCSGRRLYRTSTSGTTYLLLTTISDNSTTTYVDTIADSALGDAIDSNDRSAFPPSRCLSVHQGRLMGSCSEAAGFDKQTIYISNYREPGVCPASPDLEDPNQGTQIALQGPAGGEITGHISHGDRFYIFTWDACHVLTGDQPLDFSVNFFTRIGCVSHRTIVSTRERMIWLAADGVYEARAGAAIRRVSEPIRTFLKDLTAEQMAAAHAIIYDDRYYLMAGGEVRYLDLEYTGGDNLQWGELDWALDCSTVAYAGETTLPRIFGAKTGTKRIWEMETGEDDDGEEIPCVWTSAMWDLGLPGSDKRIHHVGATFLTGEGEATVTLAAGTAGVIETFTVDLSDPTETGGIITRLFQRAGEAARSEYFQVSVSHEKTAPYRILSVDGRWTQAT